MAERGSASKTEILIGVAAFGLLILMVSQVARVKPPDGIRAIDIQMSCLLHLIQLEDAKQRWAREHTAGPGDTPKHGEIFGTDAYLKTEPQCPGGGEYQINAVGTPPTCSIPGHGL